MSRIYKKENHPEEQFQEYLLNSFDRITVKGPTKEELFKSDREEGSEVKFIPGGFDFDVEGGLRKDEVLNRTETQARDILDRANADAEGIHDQAKSEGFEQGQQEGLSAGKSEAKPLIDTFQQLVEELLIVRGDFYKNAEEEMINLVIAISKTVFGVSIETSPDLVREVILKAVAKLQVKEEMTIKVNPEDLVEAEAVKPKLSETVESIDKVTFSVDPNLTRGGCVVETNIGSIDARIETQLDAIRESFISALEEERTKKGIKSDGE